MAFITHQPSLGKSKTTSHGVHAVFVPLYLVILAFFILLNNLAEIEEERKKEAIGSVKETFAVKIYPELIDNGVFPSVGTTNPAQNYLAPIAKVAKDLLSLVESKIVVEGDKIQIRIPLNILFSPDSNTIANSQKEFIFELSQQVRELNDGTRIEAEFIVSQPDFTESSELSPSSAIYKAGTIARTMIELGVPEKSIIIGVNSDKNQDLIMNFYKHDVLDTIRINN